MTNNHTCQDRARFAKFALETHRAIQMDDALDSPLEQMAIDLIADVLHFAHYNSLPPLKLIMDAQHQFENQCAEEIENEN